MHAPPTIESHDDSIIIGFLVSAASFAALAHYYRWGQILLSGDAVAHINIARRVFDSRTPGPAQLGTVWLPLQHILTIPFIISDWMWSSGIGGAIPSMFGYVFGVLGVYRLVRNGLINIGANARGTVIAAWLAAGIYAANPNLIYVQTTALNEALSMALLVWAVLMFTDFWQAAVAGNDALASSRLLWCGGFLLVNMLIRYDAWFHGCVILLAAVVVTIVLWRRRSAAAPSKPGFGLRGGGLGQLRKPLLTFVLLTAAAPAFWLSYNAFLWGNPLEFATGPYSAKAIEERSRRPGDPHHPGWHAPYVAAEYLVKDLELNLVEGRTERWEKTWLAVAVVGSIAILFFSRGLWPWFLLWLPLHFYAISIAWGGVPIFIPRWWPFSYYNTRYALQLLPAIAVFWGVAAYFAITGWRSRWVRVAVPVLVLAFVGASYFFVWRNVPICLREIRANGGARYALDAALANDLEHLPRQAVLLMYIGDHGGALQRAEIPLRRTINEGNFRIWDKALADPAANADFIVAGSGDQVAQAVEKNPRALRLLIVVQTPGQDPVRIYMSTLRVSITPVQ